MTFFSFISTLSAQTADSKFLYFQSNWILGEAHGFLSMKDSLILVYIPYIITICYEFMANVISKFYLIHPTKPFLNTADHRTGGRKMASTLASKPPM